MPFTITFNPKAALGLAAFVLLLLAGVDARLGVAAILAMAILDGLSLLLPMGLGRSNDDRC